MKEECRGFSIEGERVGTRHLGQSHRWWQEETFASHEPFLFAQDIQLEQTEQGMLAFIVREVKDEAREMKEED